MKRVLVTTLECGEGDFERCIDAIKSQENVEIVHEIISNKPEREAHELHIKSWNSRLDDFDAFLKVDADTVLKHDRVVEMIVDLLLSSGAAATQSPLHDFFTGDFINGLNCYAPKLNTFGTNVHELYCDRSITHHAKVLYGKDMGPEINPAGSHCHYATQLQAFHYGVHRGMKKQENTMRLVKKAHEKLGGFRRLLALEGFYQASEFKNAGKKYNYSDNDLLEAFNSTLSRLAEDASR